MPVNVSKCTFYSKPEECDGGTASRPPDTDGCCDGAHTELAD